MVKTGLFGKVNYMIRFLLDNDDGSFERNNDDDVSGKKNASGEGS